VGDNVLPNLPFFHRLLRYAQRKPSPIVVRDLVADVEKTYHHLVSDVLAFRKVLERSISHEARRDLNADKEVYIGLLAPGGYEYTVGFIAILAIGAAVVPMGEFQYSGRKSLAKNQQLLHYQQKKPRTSY
jgi:malonyl-CoA/methylmalonyl-CoA synthetase